MGASIQLAIDEVFLTGGANRSLNLTFFAIKQASHDNFIFQLLPIKKGPPQNFFEAAPFLYIQNFLTSYSLVLFQLHYNCDIHHYT